MSVLERKLAEATRRLEQALDRLENGGGNYDEVQALEADVADLYEQMEHDSDE